MLAYYIAAINIEEAYHGRRGMESEYAPFEGIVFTDTFNLGEGQGQLPGLPAGEQSACAKAAGPVILRSLWAIRRIRSGQTKSSTDQNPNVSYPALLGQRVADRPMQQRSSVTPSKISLYDSYKLALPLG